MFYLLDSIQVNWVTFIFHIKKTNTYMRKLGLCSILQYYFLWLPWFNYKKHVFWFYL